MRQVQPGRKTSVLTNLIASVCIIVYIGTLAYGAYRIYNSIQDRLAAGEQEYANLADLAVAAGVLGFMDEPFIQTIDDAIRASQTILGVIITGPNGEYAFEREPGAIITMVNNSPRFSRPFGVSNPPHYMPLRIEGQRNASIQVVTGYIDYEYCIDVLKRVLFGVLSALALAFFTLLLETLLVKNNGKTAKGRYREPEDGDWAEEKPEAEILEDDFADIENSGNEFNDLKDMPDTDENPLPADREPEAAARITEPPARQERPEPKGPQPPHTRSFLADQGAAAASSTNAAYQEAPPQETGPKGLYSPRGNIGWEEYTADRLEAELHRCASYEQDLVFLSAELAGDAGGDDLYSWFAADTVSFFTQRDLIFEMGGQGISIILPNIDLEQGFVDSREFHKRILNKDQYDIRIGLSSRAGRLIDADRLMFESFQALKKARQDPGSPIVAFKSDPEKYREFLRAKKQG
ncbi:hypothetical protein FACS189485_20210 [Spirochaetia bacterium]|nr:hypothetical protein FACS189485_20210 [Spirochaetia bacterium]